jgi:serine/threonine-protein kinase
MITCRHCRRRLLAACSIFLASALCAGVAVAQTDAQNQAAARTLFDEGRQLMKQGQYDRACPKLEAASKLYAGSGVLLNLADCYEHVGRTASAWTVFGEASSVAERSGRSDDESEAKRRQSSLESRLVRLVIRVSRPASGLTVKRDDIAVDRAAWDVAIPIDPGEHSVTAEAPGRASWSKSISTTDPGRTTTVEVPELQVVTPPPASQAPPVPALQAAPAPAPATILPAASDAPYWTGRRVAGVAIAGAGVVGMGIGGLVGLSAKSQFDTAQGESGAKRHDDSLSAVNTGNVATVIVGVGAAAAIGGAILWLTAPSASAQVGTNGREVFARGTF